MGSARPQQGHSRTPYSRRVTAACDAQDRRAEANAYVARILANHDAEVEEDLPPRTAEILFRRHGTDDGQSLTDRAL